MVFKEGGGFATTPLSSQPAAEESPNPAASGPKTTPGDQEQGPHGLKRPPALSLGPEELKRPRSTPPGPAHPLLGPPASLGPNQNQTALPTAVPFAPLTLPTLSREGPAASGLGLPGSGPQSLRLPSLQSEPGGTGGTGRTSGQLATRAATLSVLQATTRSEGWRPGPGQGQAPQALQATSLSVSGPMAGLGPVPVPGSGPPALGPLPPRPSLAAPPTLGGLGAGRALLPAPARPMGGLSLTPGADAAPAAPAAQGLSLARNGGPAAPTPSAGLPGARPPMTAGGGGAGGAGSSGAAAAAVTLQGGGLGGGQAQAQARPPVSGLPKLPNLTLPLPRPSAPLPLGAGSSTGAPGVPGVSVGKRIFEGLKGSIRDFMFGNARPGVSASASEEAQGRKPGGSGANASLSDKATPVSTDRGPQKLPQVQPGQPGPVDPRAAAGPGADAPALKQIDRLGPVAGLGSGPPVAPFQSPVPSEAERGAGSDRPPGGTAAMSDIRAEPGGASVEPGPGFRGAAAAAGGGGAGSVAGPGALEGGVSGISGISGAPGQPGAHAAAAGSPAAAADPLGSFHFAPGFVPPALWGASSDRKGASPAAAGGANGGSVRLEAVGQEGLDESPSADRNGRIQDRPSANSPPSGRSSDPTPQLRGTTSHAQRDRSRSPGRYRPELAAAAAAADATGPTAPHRSSTLGPGAAGPGSLGALAEPQPQLPAAAPQPPAQPPGEPAVQKPPTGQPTLHGLSGASNDFSSGHQAEHVASPPRAAIPALLLAPGADVARSPGPAPHAALQASLERPESPAISSTEKRAPVAVDGAPSRPGTASAFPELSPSRFGLGQGQGAPAETERPPSPGAPPEASAAPSGGVRARGLAALDPERGHAPRSLQLDQSPSPLPRQQGPVTGLGPGADAAEHRQHRPLHLQEAGAELGPGRGPADEKDAAGAGDSEGPPLSAVAGLGLQDDLRAAVQASDGSAPDSSASQGSDPRPRSGGPGGSGGVGLGGGQLQPGSGSRLARLASGVHSPRDREPSLAPFLLPPGTQPLESPGAPAAPAGAASPRAAAAEAGPEAEAAERSPHPLNEPPPHGPAAATAAAADSAEPGAPAAAAPPGPPPGPRSVMSILSDVVRMAARIAAEQGPDPSASVLQGAAPQDSGSGSDDAGSARPGARPRAAGAAHEGGRDTVGGAALEASGAASPAAAAPASKEARTSEGKGAMAAAAAQAPPLLPALGAVSDGGVDIYSFPLSPPAPEARPGLQRAASPGEAELGSGVRDASAAAGAPGLDTAQRIDAAAQAQAERSPFAEHALNTSSHEDDPMEGPGGGHGFAAASPGAAAAAADALPDPLPPQGGQAQAEPGRHPRVQLEAPLPEAETLRLGPKLRTGADEEPKPFDPVGAGLGMGSGGGARGNLPSPDSFSRDTFSRSPPSIPPSKQRRMHAASSAKPSEPVPGLPVLGSAPPSAPPSAEPAANHRYRPSLGSSLDPVGHREEERGQERLERSALPGQLQARPTQSVEAAEALGGMALPAGDGVRAGNGLRPSADAILRVLGWKREEDRAYVCAVLGRMGP